MRLVIDTNVFLDVILSREPLCHASAKALDLSARPDCELLMPAHAAGTILYITEKNRDRDTAVRALRLCLMLAHVAVLDENAITTGLEYGFADPEDSFVAAIAQRENADYIITNNIKDFTKSPVQAITPAEAVARINI